MVQNARFNQAFLRNPKDWGAEKALSSCLRSGASHLYRMHCYDGVVGCRSALIKSAPQATHSTLFKFPASPLVIYFQDLQDYIIFETGPTTRPWPTNYCRSTPFPSLDFQTRQFVLIYIHLVLKMSSLRAHQPPRCRTLSNGYMSQHMPRIPHP